MTQQSMRGYPLAADLYGDLLDTSAPAQQVGWRDHFPGLAITAIAALAAMWLSEHYGAPKMLMGLLIGLAFNFANADARLHPGLNLSQCISFSVTKSTFSMPISKISNTNTQRLNFVI